PPRGQGGRPSVQRLLVVPDPVCHLGVDQPGAYAIHPYALRAVVDRQAAGQQHQAALGRAVRGPQPAAPHPGGGGDVDDRAAARGGHRRDELPAGQERPLEVGVQQPVPLGLIQVSEPLDAEHPGRVHQQPRLAQLRADLLGGGPDRPGGEHVHAVPARPGKPGGHLRRTVSAVVQAGHREPVRGQPGTDRSADAACRAGDRGDPLTGDCGHTPSAMDLVSRIAAQNDWYTESRSPPANTSSRSPTRSTPRTHVAASAISVFRTETSRETGRGYGGGLADDAPATACRAVSRISSRAFTGCRLCAARRLTCSFTTALCTPGISFSVSSQATRSPVTSTTGTP